MTSIADTFGWTDLLSKHSMKPFVETIRSATMTAMLLSASLMFLTKPHVEISCIPINKTESDHCGTAQAQFVGKVCGLQTPWILRNLPWITALTTGFVFIANNLWLYFPGVGAAILRFAAAYDLHNELHAALPSLEIAVTTPNKQDTSEDGMKRRNKLRTFCTLLRWFMRKNERFNERQCFSICPKRSLLCDTSGNAESIEMRFLIHSHENDETIRKASVTTDFVQAYKNRNILSILAALVCFVLYILPLLPIPPLGLPHFPPEATFNCPKSAQLHERHICTYGALDLLFVTLFAFLLCSFVQIWIFIYLLCSHKNLNDLEVLQSFAENSSEKETCESFGHWIEELTKEPGTLFKEAKKQFPQAILHQDIDFFYFVYKTFGVDKHAMKIEFRQYFEYEGYNKMKSRFENIFKN